MAEAAADMDGVRQASLDGGALVLHLNNTIDAVAQGREPLAAFCRLHALPSKVANRIDVIFEELVSNAIRHGFEPGGGQSIRVLASAKADAVELVFEDDGARFDPLAAPLAPKPDSLETAKLGGLGIPLVLGLSADAAYESPMDQDPSADFRPANRLTIRVARV